MSLKRLLSSSVFFILLTVMALFLCFPTRYTESARQGISLWAVSVLPATFPFLFFTALIARFPHFYRLSGRLSPVGRRLFGVSGAGYSCALLALISGYPVGAKSVADLYARGIIGKNEVFPLSCLATTSGPAFLVGVLGGVLRRPLLGWILYLSHILAVHGTVLFFKKKAPPKTQPAPPPMSPNALYESVSSSVLSVLCVGGFIALFCVFGQMINDIFPLPEGSVLGATLRGLLEMTSGCILLLEAPAPFTLAIAAFLVTFGGLCVNLQQLAFLSPTGVKALPFLAVKLLQGLLAAALCYPLSLFFF